MVGLNLISFCDFVQRGSQLNNRTLLFTPENVQAKEEADAKAEEAAKMREDVEAEAAAIKQVSFRQIEWQK